MPKIIEPEFENLGEVVDELNCVYEVNRRYGHMLREITIMDKLTDDVGGRAMELMTEYDDCDHLNSPTIDTIRFLERNLKQQVHKFLKYEKELEATKAEFEQRERDVKQYGSYQDQVNAEYRNSKL